MTVAILCIGTELTRGELVNTNAAWLSERLVEIGFEPAEHVVVPDDRPLIVETLRRLASTSRAVLVTGGLGPTTDDFTAECAAKLLGRPLVTHEPSLEAMRRKLERAGRTMSASNAKQAELPEHAEALPNAVGTAPGFVIPYGSAKLFFMPGVPREMKAMFDEHVVPALRPMIEPTTAQRRLRTYGWPESVVGDKLAGVEAAMPGVTIGYRASVPEVEVKVHARGANLAEAQQLCERATLEVKARLLEVLYGEDDDTFPAVVGRTLRSRGLRLAIGESCTGGLVGHLLTSEPGASEFLVADIVCYANAAKSMFCGVDEDLIRAHGAVSEEVAKALAEGVRRASGADVGLAITGVAGPTGGSDAKPVGTVHFAVSTAHGTTTDRQLFTGDRQRIQRVAAFHALRLVRDRVEPRMRSTASLPDLTVRRDGAVCG
jgi:nicotinamide-nucleotide amidase